MGGTKRKIPMKKIDDQKSRAVIFSKRRDGLYSKASELCLLSNSQVAILATPVSSESNASFYSFGHSSVDNVVSAFLTNQRPLPENLVDSTINKLGFWWEDESLLNSDNPEDLREALDSISKLLQNLKGLNSSNSVEINHEDLTKKKKKKEQRKQQKKKKGLVLHETTQQGLDCNQTLNLQQ